MTYEVHNKEINSQCAELLVRPLYTYTYVYVACQESYGKCSTARGA